MKTHRSGPEGLKSVITILITFVMLFTTIGLIGSPEGVEASVRLPENRLSGKGKALFTSRGGIMNTCETTTAGFKANPEYARSIMPADTTTFSAIGKESRKAAVKLAKQNGHRINFGGYYIFDVSEDSVNAPGMIGYKATDFTVWNKETGACDRVDVKATITAWDPGAGDNHYILLSKGGRGGVILLGVLEAVMKTEYFIAGSDTPYQMKGNITCGDIDNRQYTGFHPRGLVRQFATKNSLLNYGVARGYNLYYRNGPEDSSGTARLAAGMEFETSALEILFGNQPASERKNGWAHFNFLSSIEEAGGGAISASAIQNGMEGNDGTGTAIDPALVSAGAAGAASLSGPGVESLPPAHAANIYGSAEENGIDPAATGMASDAGSDGASSTGSASMSAPASVSDPSVPAASSAVQSPVPSTGQPQMPGSIAGHIPTTAETAGQPPSSAGTIVQTPSSAGTIVQPQATAGTTVPSKPSAGTSVQIQPSAGMTDQIQPSVGAANQPAPSAGLQAQTPYPADITQQASGGAVYAADQGAAYISSSAYTVTSPNIYVSEVASSAREGMISANNTAGGITVDALTEALEAETSETAITSLEASDPSRYVGRETPGENDNVVIPEDKRESSEKETRQKRGHAAETGDPFNTGIKWALLISGMAIAVGLILRFKWPSARAAKNAEKE